MGTFKELITKRGNVKTELTSFSSYVAALDKDTVEIINLEERLNHSSPLVEKLEHVQLEIKSMSNNQTHLTYSLEFETMYFDTIAGAKKLVANKRTSLKPLN